MIWNMNVSLERRCTPYKKYYKEIFCISVNNYYCVYMNYSLNIEYYYKIHWYISLTIELPKMILFSTFTFVLCFTIMNFRSFLGTWNYGYFLGILAFDCAVCLEKILHDKGLWVMHACSSTAPWKYFKFFGGYHCIWRYGETPRVQEVQKNTFGKYFTEGIPR